MGDRGTKDARHGAAGWRRGATRLIALTFFAMGVDPGGAHGEPFDAAKLRTIALIDVIRLATIRFQFLGVADDSHGDAGLKALAALDPKVGTLVWLAVMDANLSQAPDEPTSYIATDRFFPDLIQALDAAGLARQAAIFKTAAARAKPLMPNVDAAWQSPRFVTVVLGNAFGTKAAFDDSILAYVKANPRVAAWCNVARANLTDQDRLAALLSRLAQIPDSYKLATLETWPEPYRQIEFAAIYEGELANGGIEQFFWNSSGALAR